MTAILNAIGLALGMLGTVFVARAIGRTEAGGWYRSKKGRIVHLAAVLSPTGLYVGLSLIGVGFALQVVPHIAIIWNAFGPSSD